MYLPEWSPIPIQTVDGNKVPLVSGVSGYKGVYVDRGMVDEWIASKQPHKRAGILLRDAMVGLRLPKDVIGIDLDMYGDKVGRRTFAALQNSWGELEPTWCSTSRRDGSGIFLYRLPGDADAGAMRSPIGTFPDGTPMGGIDLVRYCHMFVTCYPTYHGREGGIHQYLWFNPDGESDPDDPIWPLPEDLPYLPARWVEGLSTGRNYVAGAKTALTGKASDWLKSRPCGEGPLCSRMQRDLDAFVKLVEYHGRAGGCYPVVNKSLLQLVGNAAEGHGGAFLAVTRLWSAYREAMNENTRRSPADVEREFTKSLRGAIEGLPARKFNDEDPCDWKL